jgi:hypothetical protein
MDKDTTTKPTEMTPKEQAEELINKFKHSESQDGYNDVRDIYAAIRCALIAVDQILSDYKNYLLHENTDYKGLMYWKEVKQELEKL